MRWRSARVPALEVLIAAAALLACAWLGSVTGWKGRPKTDISTQVWPFYLDTWFPRPVYTWRALLPLAALAPFWLAARRWLRSAAPAIPSLLLTVGAAYGVYFACGIERHGFVAGLQHTLSRGQEYWNDVRWVHAGFLARFPEVGGALSQHGATHPPGLILVLAGVQALGAKSRMAATLVCSLAAPLTALPLYGAARRLADEKTARIAIVLFLSSCSVTAMAILAMDIFTMLLAATALYGFARALDGDRAGGALWGTAFAAATLCNYIAATLSLTYAVLLWARFRELDRKRWSALAMGPTAFLLFYGLLAGAFGYRPFHAFAANLTSFAGSENLRRSASAALIGNPVALLGALGLPLMGLYGRAMGRAIRGVARPEERSTAALVLSAALPPAICTLIGAPRGEVEHIFLLFVPALTLGAAAAARRWFDRGERWLLWFALPAMVIQSTLIEIYFETYW